MGDNSKASGSLTGLTKYSFSQNRARYSILQYLQARTREAAAELPSDFQTLEEWEGFKESFLPRLKRLLGFSEHRSPMKSEVLDRRQINQYIRERVDFLYDRGRYVPCFIVRPLNRVERRLPAVVISPGWPQTKWTNSFNHIAERWVDAGFITLIPDHPPFGETADSAMPNNMINLMNTCMALGIPYEGIRGYELIRAVDYLVTRGDVDPERICLTGLCQGSIDLWFSAAFEPRFKAIAPVCGTTTFEAWALEYINYANLGDASPCVPSILKVCDVQHIYASWAPRPVLVQNNVNDNWWPMSGYDKVVALARKVYRLYGVPERFEAELGNEVHDITPRFEKRILNFFQKWV